MIDSFLQYLQVEKNYSFHTLEAYGNDLLQFEKFVSGNEPLEVEGVDAVIVRRWMVALMAEGYSPLSVNRKLSTLKSFFRFLVRNKILESNPLRTLSGPKVNKPLPHFVRDSEMDQLFANWEDEDSFESERDKAILEVFYSTGIRCSELVGLRDVDVDFSARLIKVTGKRNKERLIPFSLLLEEVLHSYLRKRDAELNSRADSSLFVTPDGEPLTNSRVYRIVTRRLSEVPNLSRRSPHVLRHTFATGMMNNGADLNAVKELLGHASLSSTEVYTHTTLEELKKAYHQAHPRA